MKNKPEPTPATLSESEKWYALQSSLFLRRQERRNKAKRILRELLQMIWVLTSASFVVLLCCGLVGACLEATTAWRHTKADISTLQHDLDKTRTELASFAVTYQNQLAYTSNALFLQIHPPSISDFPAWTNVIWMTNGIEIQVATNTIAFTNFVDTPYITNLPIYHFNRGL